MTVTDLATETADGIDQGLPPIALRKAVMNTTDRPGLPNVYGLHHWAYRCRDSEETRHFYEDILGLPLAAAVFHERVPSTQEYCPTTTSFSSWPMVPTSPSSTFSTVNPIRPTPDTPSWLHHMALEVDNRQSLIDAKTRLEAAGVSVLGIIDHGWFDSIYFFDPNGMRLELTYRTASLANMKARAQAARVLLADRPNKIAELAKRVI